jgi:hypothetical protein
MVSIVRFLIVVVVVCVISDRIQAQEKVKSAKLEITSSLMDKGKRERLRQIYNRFWKETKIPFKCSYLVLNNLSRAGSSIESGEAFDCMNTYLATLEHNRKVQFEFTRELEREFGNVYREVSLQSNAYKRWTFTEEGCALASLHR